MSRKSGPQAIAEGPGWGYTDVYLPIHERLSFIDDRLSEMTVACIAVGSCDLGNILQTKRFSSLSPAKEVGTCDPLTVSRLLASRKIKIMTPNAEHFLELKKLKMVTEHIAKHDQIFPVKK